jgi:hypothetical protein
LGKFSLGNLPVETLGDELVLLLTKWDESLPELKSICGQRLCGGSNTPVFNSCNLALIPNEIISLNQVWNKFNQICKTSLSSSAWQIGVPELQKGMHGIPSPPQRQGRSASPKQIPLLRAAVKTETGRRRHVATITTTSHWLVLLLL